MKAESKLTYRVRGAVKLYDSYTNRSPIMSSIRVVADEGISIIRKSEGILVFIENNNLKATDSFDIKLQSPVYTEERLSFSLKGAAEIKSLRLSPKAGYPIPYGASFIYGKALEGTDVFFSYSLSNDRLRLLEDIGKEDKKIKLYHPGKKSLEGYLIQLENKTGLTRILLDEIVAKDGQDVCTYTFHRELKSEFKRNDTLLSLVNHTRADENGSYMLLVNKEEADEGKGKLYFEAEEIQSLVQIQLSEGGNKWDLEYVEGQR